MKPVLLLDMHHLVPIHIECFLKGPYSKVVTVRSRCPAASTEISCAALCALIKGESARCVNARQKPWLLPISHLYYAAPAIRRSRPNYRSRVRCTAASFLFFFFFFFSYWANFARGPGEIDYPMNSRVDSDGSPLTRT